MLKLTCNIREKYIFVVESYWNLEVDCSEDTDNVVKTAWKILFIFHLLCSELFENIMQNKIALQFLFQDIISCLTFMLYFALQIPNLTFIYKTFGKLEREGGKS